MQTDSFFLLIHKPVGGTSQQALTLLKKQHGFKKLGHHGTLDPFASGLLLVGVGEATKFFQFIDDTRKTYTATLKLGLRTDTLDHTGQIVETQTVPELTENKIQEVLKSLTGSILQTPPMYSALKKEGVPLYKLARRGETVERAPREIQVETLKLLGFTPDTLAFEACVSRGTYIRVLGEQIAQKLGTVGHLTALCRTHLVGMDLEAASVLESGELRPILIPDLLLHLKAVFLDANEARDLYHGKSVRLAENSTGQKRLYCGNDFLGVGELSGGVLMSLRLMSHSREGGNPVAPTRSPTVRG